MERTRTQVGGPSEDSRRFLGTKKDPKFSKKPTWSTLPMALALALANVVSILVKEVRRSHHGCLLGSVAEQLQYLALHSVKRGKFSFI